MSNTEALKAALAAMTKAGGLLAPGDYFDLLAPAIDATRAALAQAEQPEPARHCRCDGAGRLAPECDGTGCYAERLNEKAEQPAEQAQPELCMCKDRPKSECPGEWEPGCDLGNNHEHVRIVHAPPKAAEQAQPAREPFITNDMVASALDAISKRHEIRPTVHTMAEALHAALLAAPPAAQPLTDADIEAVMGPCEGSAFAEHLRREFIKSFKRVYFKLHPERAHGIGAQEVKPAQEGGV